MNILILQLRALRAACVAVIAAVDLYETLAQEESAPPAPPVPPTAPVDTPPAEEDKVFNQDAALCQHPRTHWMRAPAMGKPNRMMCRCGEEMEVVQS